MNPQNRFQFSLKQMLWGAFSGAVIAAVAAQFVHRMSPPQTLLFAGYLAALAVGFVVARIFKIRRGGTARAAAGQFFSEWSGMAPLVVVRVVLLVYLVLIISSAAFSASSFAYTAALSSDALKFYIIAAAFSLLSAFLYGGWYGYFLYDGGTLAIFEHGIVLSDRLFIPWGDIKSYSWNDSHTRRKIRFSLRPCYVRSKVPRLHRKFLRVPAAARDQFEALLTTNGVACESAVAPV